MYVVLEFLGERIGQPGKAAHLHPHGEVLQLGVSPIAGPEKEGLENLQRGFDFYSWRTFIELNSPAVLKITVDHAPPDTATRWDMDNFKQPELEAGAGCP
jgi:hypothetical protein